MLQTSADSFCEWRQRRPPPRSLKEAPKSRALLRCARGETPAASSSASINISLRSSRAALTASDNRSQQIDCPSDIWIKFSNYLAIHPEFPGEREMDARFTFAALKRPSFVEYLFLLTHNVKIKRQTFSLRKCLAVLKTSIMKSRKFVLFSND